MAERIVIQNESSANITVTEFQTPAVTVVSDNTPVVNVTQGGGTGDGAPGEQGIQGVQGVQGTQGTQGIKGEPGTAVAQGAQGIQGIQGIQGAQGIQGLAGEFAAQGIQGAQGLQGIQGIGSPGEPGEPGAQGAQGIQGIQGTGLQGIQGIQGIAGDSADTSFNGDRIVSNADLGDLFTAQFNAGTTSTISDFLEAVFFTSTAPTITTTSLTIGEFEQSGSIAGTVTATDAENQAVTFSLDSSYTDGLFDIASNGQVTALTKTLRSANTNTTVVTNGAHPLPVIATDTAGNEKAKTIYVRVLPNTSPVFRDNSPTGNIITSKAINLTEASTPGQKGVIYATDADGDAVTVTATAITPSGDFSATVTGNQIAISQIAQQLDYGTTSFYSLTVTVKDEHYVSGDDNTSTADITIAINISPNIGPTIDDQTITGVSENSTAGTIAGTLQATDPEGNTITFSNFTLQSVHLETGPDIKSTISDTNLRDPFQLSTAGVVTRKVGAVLDEDTADKYVYQATVSDAFNQNSDTGLITIPILGDVPPSITRNSTNFYIIESAGSGDSVRTNSNGRTGIQADFNSNQVVTWSVAPSIFSISTTGALSMGADVSPTYTSGGSISGTVTATNAFGTTNSDPFTVSVAANQPPSISYSDTSVTRTEGLVSAGDALVNVALADPEGDTPITFALSGTNFNSFTYSNGVISASSALPAGTYTFTGTATDSFGKQASENRTVVIAANQAPVITTSNILSNPTADNATSGTDLINVTITDPEGSAISNVLLSGTDHTSFSITSSGNGWKISAATNLAAGSYSFNITAQDSLGNVGTEPATYTVQAAVTTATVYVYGNTRGVMGLNNTQATALAVLGDNGSIITNSPIDKFQGGSIGSSSITVPGGTLTLKGSVSLTDLEDFDTIGNLSLSQQQLIILIPDTTNLANIPTSLLTGSFPATSNVAGRKALYALDPTAPGAENASIYDFSLDTGVVVDGYSNWKMIYTWNAQSANYKYFIIDDQASAPTS